MSTRFLLGLLLVLVISGCASTLENRTASQIPANPSGIYTFSAEVSGLPGGLIEGTTEVFITIDGNNLLAMSESPIDGIWRYDYRFPAGKDRVAYYFTLRYQTENNQGEIRDREIVTEQVFYSELVNRYASQLEVDRAPVGTPVAILGRNLLPSDQVEIGGVAADTTFESPRSIRFIVPPLAPGRTHSVRIISSRGNINVGGFRVDAAELEVIPEVLDLTPGATEMMIFSTPTPAPSGGLEIRVTTDVPDLLIMPEVVIPAGERSVNVRVEGGEPGSGTVFVEAPGYGEVELPIDVR